MKGKRLPDLQYPDMHFDAEPGEYWKYTGIDLKDSHPTNLTRVVWGFRGPGDTGFGRLFSHTVRENDDGTISVIAGDGSSNSILHQGPRGEVWHGYIDHDEWNEC